MCQASFLLNLVNNTALYVDIKPTVYIIHMYIFTGKLNCWFSKLSSIHLRFHRMLQTRPFPVLELAPINA